MTIHFGSVPAGSVLPVHFGSYNSAGASVTLTGLAITDVKIYKGTTVTQRASDAGVVLIDTDGIDIDAITGAHGFSIDTGDDTDASFYAIGSFFNVWVSAVTIDSQTVNFLAATFRIVAAETVAGTPQARASAIADGAISATTLATDTITAAKLHSDVTTELQNGLATAAALATVDGIVDDILVDTAVIGALGAGLTALASQASVDALPTAAEINAEVVDALNVDTYAEPGQGTPAATTTITGKLGYLYKAWRNKHTQTATEYGLYNDDTTTLGQKAAVSDDATTFERGEIATGA